METIPKTIFNRLIKKLKRQHQSFSLLMGIIKECPENNFFISGGTVRDTLLETDKIIKDIDIFLSASGFETISGFLIANGIVVNNQFGTKRWFPKNELNFYYDFIPIPNFYNGLWKCRDITDVLNQFDITANAVAFDLLNGKFYDPQNGYQDIKNHILRAVRFDFPELPVSADINISRLSVLWFRYHYYSKKLNFEIEPFTLKWLNDNNYRLQDLEKFKVNFFDPQIA